MKFSQALITLVVSASFALAAPVPAAEKREAGPPGYGAGVLRVEDEAEKREAAPPGYGAGVLRVEDEAEKREAGPPGYGAGVLRVADAE